MAASFADDLISVRSHKKLNLNELLDNLPKQLTKDVLQQLHAAVLDCDPELIPQQEAAVSSVLVAVLDERAPPARRHLALSVLEALCPQYGLEEMLLPLPPQQLALFLPALLAQGTDSPHYRCLVEKLLSALEDAGVAAPLKREILLYLTRVVEAQPDLLSLGDTERVLKQLPGWLLDCSLFSSPRLVGVSSVTGPAPSAASTSRFRRSESTQPVSELDGVVSQETFTVLTSAKFHTGDQWLNGAAFSVLCVWLRQAVLLGYSDDSLGSACRKYCLCLLEQARRKPVHVEDAELQQYCLVEAVRALDLVCQLDATQVPEVILVVQRMANSSHLLARAALTLGTALLQFFLHHGSVVLHKTGDSLSQFFLGPVSRAWLSGPSALQVVHFTLRNLEALCEAGATEKYFPALLKIFAWNPQQFKSQFQTIVPAFMSAKTAVEVFHSLVDLPALAAALVLEWEASVVPEGLRLKRRSSSSAALVAELQQGPMLKFVLRDVSGIGDTFEGLSKFHSLIADLSTDQRVVRCSEHAPDLLECFLKTFVQYGDSQLAARLLPAVMERLSVCYGARGYCDRLRKVLAGVLPQLFCKFPDVTFLLTSELVEFLSHTSSYDVAPDFFANLVWAVGEHASPSESPLCSPQAVGAFFEVLECQAFELLSSGHHAGAPLSERRTRLLCIVITSLSKLAVRSQDLVARALLCLSKTGQLCSSHPAPSTTQGGSSGGAMLPQGVLERRVHELTAIIQRSGAASAILTPPREEELKRHHEDLAQLPALVRLVTAVMSTQE